MKSLSVAIVGAAYLYYMSTINEVPGPWTVILLMALIFFIMAANNK